METAPNEQEHRHILRQMRVQVVVLLACAWIFLRASLTPTEFHPDDMVQPESLTLKVDLNTADEFELDLLPRVGPGLARRIVADRQANGSYHTTTDLLRVPGIGAKTFAQLQEYLVVP